ncbi:hypothetical protein GCM10023215_21110 [Pseudonocardia yuanmonensis]|uniref:HTH merR-type domain-containing protein n=1 Tax=Pseudonocardia yuanmonensis TaxID=1095914 RepID=A0ABP8WBT4_9PSEU
MTLALAPHWDDLDDQADDLEPRVRHLFSAAEAERVLGIKAGTVRQWAHRGQLHPVGLDERDRPLYDREHLQRLEGRSTSS